MRYIYLLTILILLTFINPVYGKSSYSNEEIVNAIYKAENSVKYPYGIKSLKYENRDDRSLNKHDWARMICLNTVRNQKVRHSKHDCGKDYLTCLWLRYCPPEAHKLNKNWLENVKFFLVQDKR